MWVSHFRKGYFFTLVKGQFAALLPFFLKKKHPVYFFTLEGLAFMRWY